MNNNIILTHHWLKHAREPVFHAYLQLSFSYSLCRQSNFVELRDMHTPSVHSPLCMECFLIMFNLNKKQPFVLSLQKKDFYEQSR